MEMHYCETGNLDEEQAAEMAVLHCNMSFGYYSNWLAGKAQWVYAVGFGMDLVAFGYRVSNSGSGRVTCSRTWGIGTGWGCNLKEQDNVEDAEDA